MENNTDHFNENVIDDIAYNGNPLLKKERVQINWTPEMIQEYIKCKNDCQYFIEKYVKIITEDGLQPFILRDYQIELIESMNDNRYTIGKLSRQSGKCITTNSNVTVRNKKTGEILNITIGDFYNCVNEDSKPA